MSLINKDIDKYKSLPKVKIIPKKKLKIFKGFNADQYLKKFNNFEFSFDEPISKKSKKGKKNEYYLFYKPQTVYARGGDLAMVELKVYLELNLHFMEKIIKIK